MWMDSHAHVDGFVAPGALASMLRRAAAAGVEHLVAVGGSDAMNEAARLAARLHPACVSAALGFDRDQAAVPPPVGPLRDLLRDPAVVAVGECGLDYHYHRDTASAQQILFERMLELAREVRKPVIVHAREAEDDMVRLLRAHGASWRGDPGRLGVIHCFTGSPAFARDVLDLGFHIGISGIVTFPRAEEVRAVARLVPEDRLLIETDTPYLAPVPFRGQPNEPAHVKVVGEALAALRGVPPERLACTTSANARRLFDIPAGASR